MSTYISSDIQANNNKLSSNMKVEIQSKKWIKPATPTPFHLQKFKLSSIDQLQPPMLVQPIFFFDHISSSETDQVGKTTIPERLIHLEESLSKVLTLYYPFAGRYDEDDESLVSCQDQGVAFVVAKVDPKLADGEYDTRVLFSALESLQTSNPLVLVQVNIFRCGGLAIGLGVSHKLCDMFTISTFMSAWADACRLGTLDTVISPSFGFSSLLPAHSRIDHFQFSNSDEPLPSIINTATPPKYVVKRYVFTGEAIAKMKSSISESCTRVELVMALITRSLTNIEKPKHNKPLVIAQPMNFRSKTGLPIEDNSFGNLLISVKTNCGQLDDGLLSWELPEVAKLIKSSIKNVASEMRKVGDWGELNNKVVKATLEFYEEIIKGESVNLVMFSSWCRFSLYEVDFGWGRPTLVSTVPVPHNFICLMDCKSDTGGIEALVCFKEQDMALFQQESDILEYASF